MGKLTKKSTRKRISVLVATLFALSMLVTLVFSVPMVGANVTSNDLNISPLIKGEEYTVIKKIIETLDLEDRENVIYITESGKVYANKPELKNEVVPLKHVKDNIYENPEGYQFVFPDETIGVSTSEITYQESQTDIVPLQGTGPFRRVKSKNGTQQTPYAWTCANVHIGKKPADVYDNDSLPSGDTAYVYLGGTGGDGAHLEVDAGLQHSFTNDNWTLVMKVENGANGHDLPRFKSDQNVFFKFYVNDNDSVTVKAQGFDVDNNWQERTVCREASGWRKDGIGNAMKRCTTIAQIIGYENLLSGSYHKNVRWYECKIGASSTNNHYWSGSDIGESSKYPNDSRVTVQWTNWANETVHINLN
jgi:hypothetical protein